MVFERLANDVRLRSVATRLVQRYGYLEPSVNPDSEMGKQQDFILKERARKLVQTEAQDDQYYAELKKSQQQGQRNNVCGNSNLDNTVEGIAEDVDCRDRVPSGTRGEQDQNLPGGNNQRNALQQRAGPESSQSQRTNSARASRWCGPSGR